jgi:hypothetical protein
MLADAMRLKEWTRSRFALPRDATVSVSQVECTIPGCPSVETVVMFWTGAQHYHFKVFKPLAEVRPEDLPPAWFKEALAASPGECGCC